MCDTVKGPIHSTRIKRTTWCRFIVRHDCSHCSHDVFGLSIKEVRGAKFLSKRFLFWNSVHGDDRGGTLNFEGLNDIESNATNTKDQGRLTALDIGAIEYRTHASDNTTTDKCCRGQWHIFGDLDALNIANQSSFSKSARCGKVVNCLTIKCEWSAGISESGATCSGTSVHAVLAKATSRQSSDDDMVARLHMSDGIADFCNNSSSFVTTDARRRNGVHAAHIGDVTVA